MAPEPIAFGAEPHPMRDPDAMTRADAAPVWPALHLPLAPYLPYKVANGSRTGRRKG